MSMVRHPTAKKISTTDYCDREKHLTGCVPQTAQKVYPKHSDKLSTELATVQEIHHLLYRAERLVRKSRVGTSRRIFRRLSTMVPLSLQDLIATPERAEPDRPIRYQLISVQLCTTGRPRVDDRGSRVIVCSGS